MPVEFIVDSLDKVDESIRGAYVEREGKHHFDADLYSEIKAQGLKTKNKELLGKLKEAETFKGIAEKFKDVTDDDFEEFTNWRTTKDNPPPTDKGDISAQIKAAVDEALKRERNKFSTKETGLTTQLSELQKENRELKIWNPVTVAAAAAGVMPDRLDSLMKILRSDARFELSDDGKPLFIDRHGNQTDMPIDKAFGALKDEFAWAFASSQTGGSGANNNNGGSGSGTDFSKLSPVEQLKAYRRQGAK
jgi:hypothetical protein